LSVFRLRYSPVHDTMPIQPRKIYFLKNKVLFIGRGIFPFFCAVTIEGGQFSKTVHFFCDVHHGGNPSVSLFMTQFDEMVSIDPSCNTDQGVLHVREYLGYTS